MKRSLIILGVAVPLTVFTVFSPGVVHNLTFGILLWDVTALLLATAVLVGMNLQTTPIRAFVLCLVLVLILCSVWSVVYYPVSRVFIMGRVVGETGLASLPSLSEADITRLIRGNCFIVLGCIGGAVLAIMKNNWGIRTKDCTI